MVYPVGVGKMRNKTERIAFRTTPAVKRLAQAIADAEGFATEGDAVEAAIREYAVKRRILPTNQPAAQEKQEGT